MYHRYSSQRIDVVLIHYLSHLILKLLLNLIMQSIDEFSIKFRYICRPSCRISTGLLIRMVTATIHHFYDYEQGAVNLLENII